MATVTELFAKFGLDVQTSGFLKAELAARGIAKAFEAAAGALGGVARATVGVITETVRQAGALDETSKRVGVNVEALQELQYAARLNGVSSEGLASSLQFVARNAYAAATGSKESAAAFGRLGINIRKANGELKAGDELMMEVSDVFRAMPDGVEKTALSMQLFGRSGAQLIPMLSDQENLLADVRQEARDLGLVMDEETVGAGDKLGDSFDTLQDTIGAFRHAIAGPLLAPLTKVIKAMTQWIKLNRSLILSKAKVLVDALGTAFGGLSKVVPLLMDNWKTLGAVLTAVGVIGLAAGVKMAAAWLAAAAGPILLIGLLAGVLLVLEDVWVALNGGDSLLGEFLRKLGGRSPGDPWWKTAILDTLDFLKDLATTVPKAIADMRLIMGDFFDWVINQAMRAGNAILQGLTGGLLGTKGDAAALMGGGLRGLLKAGMSMAPGMGALSAAESLFGVGAAGPGASVQNSTSVGGSTVNAPRVNTTVNVTAAPGQSPEEVGQAVSDAMRNVLDAELQKAYGAG